MKDILKYSFIIIVILAFLAIGIMFITDFAKWANTPDEVDEPDSTFVEVEQELLGSYHYKIVYHKDTKVMYVIGHYNDFTIMLNADGTPVIWEGD